MAGSHGIYNTMLFLKNFIGVGMSLWSDIINEWFDKKLIASGKIISENQVIITLGKVGGFNFYREIVPFDSGITCVEDKRGQYMITYNSHQDSSKHGKDVFDSLYRRSEL
jgi:hypothetical protein